jgi:nucleoside-diphosphate-sugar epimerase
MDALTPRINLGVEAIIHLASPVDFSLTSVEAFMHPAVNGNLSILNSALKAGPQLRSFVLTSSIAAISDVTKPEDYAFSEADWNRSGEKIARRYFLPGVAYAASKTAAERVLWAWTKRHRPSFSVSAVNPAVVIGPPVLFPSSPRKLNETLKPLWKIFSGEARTIPPGIGPQSYVHVDDVAALHIWCMEHPAESNGQRYLAANGTGTTQAMADILRREYPDRDIVVGKPGSNYVEGYRFVPGKRTYISAKAYRALGAEEYGFTGFEEAVLETARSFEQQWPNRLRNRRY